MVHLYIASVSVDFVLSIAGGSILNFGGPYLNRGPLYLLYVDTDAPVSPAAERCAVRSLVCVVDWLPFPPCIPDAQASPKGFLVLLYSIPPMQTRMANATIDTGVPPPSCKLVSRQGRVRCNLRTTCPRFSWHWSHVFIVARDSTSSSPFPRYVPHSPRRTDANSTACPKAFPATPMK